MKQDNSYSVWSDPPNDLTLQPNQVDVWRISLNLEPDSVKPAGSFLSADESKRAARFHFPADRDHYIAAHTRLRDILTRYIHCSADELAFSTNPHGKPWLRSRELEFNLSHSGDFALVAVAGNRRVGIDLERIRPGISAHVIARQYFSKAEVEELENLQMDQREAAFFTCWTRKEAFIKARGLGLSLPLESFDVSLTPNEPAILRAVRPDAEEAARWSLHSLDIDPSYAAALAVESVASEHQGTSKDQNLEFRLWDWNSYSF
jgi:4'-phosphopantetheinyl transferase